MHDDSFLPFDLPAVSRKKVCASFDGGAISSNGGLLLLREANRRLGLTSMLASCVQDRRDPSRISHVVEEMLLFRIMAIACGYEDADDCDLLRDDPLFKLAAGRQPESGERRAVVLAADHEPVREHAHPDGSSADDGDDGGSVLQ